MDSVEFWALLKQKVIQYWRYIGHTERFVNVICIYIYKCVISGGGVVASSKLYLVLHCSTCQIENGKKIFWTIYRVKKRTNLKRKKCSVHYFEFIYSKRCQRVDESHVKIAIWDVQKYKDWNVETEEHIGTNLHEQLMQWSYIVMKFTGNMNITKDQKWRFF